ncbi:MAG: TIGR00341 family protein [Flavobacteriales bacterium]|nr:TIGR00341 family protein [Flavobacteriales bacterium]MBK7481876.1 TIGR00341 family protein [Flavobacteriales bacterium]MBK8532313.1 TIGR00341 family protein [Flavobacteriales bacterium]MBK9629373.1 TIGR00341 family protein [Flavobacteriales bacterium]
MPIPILRILSFFRLGDNAEDPNVAIESIERNVVFRGTNLLILVFAIIIASVGLNVNSAAVIIGAMLISPLMGPIVGVGAGLGVRDLDLVRKALKNLTFAVAASVGTSTIYFLISPLGDAHSEILARTSPTIWDVLIATAGGFAGIIATASKDRGNVVPGVAIATALMPPLCTAGYGLAHGNWVFFAGAFYLFLINSVFISLSALATVRWLRYPVRHHSDERTSKRIRSITTMVVLLTVIPSVILAFRLVKQNSFNNKAMRFVDRETIVANNFLVEKVVDAPSRSIKLVYMGSGIDSVVEKTMRRQLEVYDLQEAELTITTGLSLNELGQEARTESERLRQQLQEQQVVVARLASLNDSLSSNKWQRERIMQEAQAQHADLRWLVVADAPATFAKSDSTEIIVSAHFTILPDTADQGRLERWLNVKLYGRRFAMSISADSVPDPPKRSRR